MDPLIVGPDKTNSDARVFAANGNDAMRTLCQPAVSTDACAPVPQHMIDSVPSAVELSDVVEQYIIKPSALQPAHSSNGTLTVGERARVRIAGPSDIKFTVAPPYAARE